jgi:hypothetical protein
LNNRVLDGDHGLIAEGFGQRDFVLTEDICLFSTQREQVDAFTLAHQRQILCRVYADRLMDVALAFGQVDERPVRHVKRLLLDDGTRGKVGAGIDRLFYQLKFVKQAFRRGRCRNPVDGRVAKHHQRHVAAGQPHGGKDDGFEHRLRVGRRTGDHLENVCGAGLALQGLPQFPGEPRHLGFPVRSRGPAAALSLRRAAGLGGRSFGTSLLT